MKNKKLITARIDRDMNQQDLAEAVGVTRQTIGLIESGTYNPTLKLCVAICKALDKSLNDLFWEDQLMSKQPLIDERITQLRDRIQSDACIVLIIILFTSVFIQQLLMDAPFTQYAVELISALGISVYVVGRYLLAGIDLKAGQSWNPSSIKGILTAGLLVTAILGVANYLQYGDRYENIGLFLASLVIMFISSTLGIAILSYVMNDFNTASQKRLEKKLQTEE